MYSEKIKRNLSIEAQEMNNRLSQNYLELQYRQSEFAVTRTMVEQEEALEDLLFDFTDDEVNNTFVPIFASQSRTAAAGVPLRSEGAAGAAFTALPPIDNMGLHKYRDAKPLTEQQKNEVLQAAVMHREHHSHKTLGGYDGGVEIGFHGEWDAQAFAAILDQLEHARKMAESERRCGDECYITLGDRVFLVEPQGCKIGVYYRYIFTGHGIKFYLHHAPNERIQPVRLRYNHDALVGRDLFQVHAITLDWLEQIGFHVTKETLSRVDLQVTLQRATADFMNLIAGGHVVRKTRKSDIHMDGLQTQTFTAGKATQICIYDKKQELEDGGDEIKTRLVVKHLLGLDLPEEDCMVHAPLFLFDHLTRVEFRLRRSRLREMGIDSIADLKEKELSLVAFMTEEWFRILESPKVRGHENTQQVHELWREVQQLFRHYFPGDDMKRSEINRGRDNGIKCTGEALLQQAKGCLASFLALTQGSGITEEKTVLILTELIRNNSEEITQRAGERAKEIETTRGFIPIQHATPTHRTQQAHGTHWKHQTHSTQEMQWMTVLIGRFWIFGNNRIKMPDNFLNFFCDVKRCFATLAKRILGFVTLPCVGAQTAFAVILQFYTTIFLMWHAIGCP